MHTARPQIWGGQHEAFHEPTSTPSSISLRSTLLRPGTLYPLLYRMEAAGLLTSRDTLVEGRRRRLYSITETGQEALHACRAALAELAAEVLPEPGAAAGRLEDTTMSEESES